MPDDYTKIVLEEIFTERMAQDNKWGEQNHWPAVWCMILGEEVGEVNKAALEAWAQDKGYEEYRKELIQVAAVACAAVESLDRQERRKEENGESGNPTG